MSSDANNMHVHLRAWRKARHMTLETVAAQIGSKANTISGWETGSRQVGLDDLKKLAEVYGCHPAALLFAPPGGEDFERMKAASEMLTNMTPEAADEWLAIGRRIARSEKMSD